MQRMAKALIVLVCCLFVGAGSLAEQQATVTHQVSLRGDPLTANPPIGYLRKNETVTLLADRTCE